MDVSDLLVNVPYAAKIAVVPAASLPEPKRTPAAGLHNFEFREICRCIVMKPTNRSLGNRLLYRFQYR